MLSVKPRGGEIEVVILDEDEKLGGPVEMSVVGGNLGRRNPP